MLKHIVAVVRIGVLRGDHDLDKGDEKEAGADEKAGKGIDGAQVEGLEGGVCILEGVFTRI